MATRATGTARLGLFSDGVFAVLITILVLELKPPHADNFGALLPLWPTGLSYAVSYLFIAIVWVNHHHLFSYAELAIPRLTGRLRAGEHHLCCVVLGSRRSACSGPRR